MCGCSILPVISYRRLNQKLKLLSSPPLFLSQWISAKQIEILEHDTTIKFCLHAPLAVVSFSRVELTELAMIFQ